jgi:oligoribonuclease
MKQRRINSRRKDRLVWIDCEMTGLDPSKHVLLEIATIVTDYDLNVVAEGPALTIRNGKVALARMDPWSRRTHTKSGLLARVEAEGVALEDAERQTLRFLRRWCFKRSAPLAGSSVWQDRRFLVKYMPRLHDFLHYRIVDVSSIKVLAAHWYSGCFPPPQKRGMHLALSDIEESIDELRHYRRYIFRKPKSR